MELESVKKFLEKGGETASMVNEFPPKFLETLIMSSLRVDLIEPGRVICSMIIPPRLLVLSPFLHHSSFFLSIFQFNSLSFLFYVEFGKFLTRWRHRYTG